MADHRRLLRAAPEQLATTAGLGLLIALLLPIWIVHETACRVLTRRGAGVQRQVPRLAAGGVDLEDVMRRRRPVVMEGLADRLRVRDRCDLAALRSFATTDHGRFSVGIHRDHSPYFLYTGDYGAELDHVAEMTPHEFLDRMFHERDDDHTCIYRLFGPNDLGGMVGEIIDDYSKALSSVVDRRPERSASGVWIGSSGVVTPLHHDAWSGLLFQTHGTKRVVLFSPVDRPNLYFNSPLAVGSRWSRLPGRSNEADRAVFPRVARATRHETTLRSGDVLYIPPFWSHEIEALESNISIPFRFAVEPRDRLNPGALRPTCETFRSKCRAAVRRVSR